jgi:hypothetical protein
MCWGVKKDSRVDVSKSETQRKNTTQLTQPKRQSEREATTA